MPKDWVLRRARCFPFVVAVSVFVNDGGWSFAVRTVQWMPSGSGQIAGSGRNCPGLYYLTVRVRHAAVVAAAATAPCAARSMD